MNAKSLRMRKEVRAMFWPWCLVMAAAVTPLVLPQSLHEWLEPIGMIGFYGGILFLAALSFGNEYQHRTLTLLLAQPVDRMEIWREKLTVTLVAVISTAMVFFLCWRSTAALGPTEMMLVGAWVIAVSTSAPYWTILVRSTLGGFVLTFGVPQAVIMLSWAILPVDVRKDLWPANTALATVYAFALLTYAVVMLLLGRRALARLQVSGGMAGDDLMVAGPSVMPEFLAGLFRSRPTGATLNLVRKELRLLRPVWLITAVAIVGWTSLVLSGSVPERGSARQAPVIVVIVAITSLLTTIIPGCLSLGEERTSGTHAWHMTLPVSARRQWLVKMLTAVIAGPVCAVIIPYLILVAGGAVLGSPSRFVSLRGDMSAVLGVALLSFASFWCACAVNGTVRAALWVFPALGILFLTIRFGAWVGEILLNLVESRFDLFADFGFTNSASNLPFDTLLEHETLTAAALLSPVLLVALVQSYRLFRKQLQDSALFVVRRLSPLAIIVLFISVSLAFSLILSFHAKQQMWTMFQETHQAIEKVHPDLANLDAAHPLQITGEDLAKASPLSERTRRWLGRASITVAPDRAQPRRQDWLAMNSRGLVSTPNTSRVWYLATIRRPGGSQCTISYHGGIGYGILGGICK